MSFVYRVKKESYVRADVNYRKHSTRSLVLWGRSLIITRTNNYSQHCVDKFLVAVRTRASSIAIAIEGNLRTTSQSHRSGVRLNS